MSTTLDLVKQAYAAGETKDNEALRSILHKNYKAKMPGMEVNGIAEVEKMIDTMPMEGHSENESYIEDGNKVVRIWDWVSTKPTPNRLRMAELTVVEDGKVIFNEAFFDTSGFPKEVKEQMKQESKRGN